jgi:arginyl-tRNA synthetase
MNIAALLQERFAAALLPLTDAPRELLSMIRPAQDPRFGDYQANCAMPLAKQLKRPPRDVAADIARRLDVEDLCQPPEVAGPGFINLRLRDDWLAQRLQEAARDERVGVAPVSIPRTFVIDYSSPNVAKPMHVGHIRSTVIGDALCRTLRFLGHRVISDNHLGDWGTQFGMIIYGYKHFVARQAYEQQPVAELSRLYRLVHRLVDYSESRRELPRLERRLVDKEDELRGQPSSATGQPHARRRLLRQCEEAREALEATRERIAAVDGDPELSRLVRAHPQIEQAVLEETAKLHAGDAENLRLWQEFLPYCRQEIQRLYARLDVSFDHEYGESYYQDQLADVVTDFLQRNLARESEGATCVFLDGYETPMLIRKKDGAFLYATTDLATIRYRLQRWHPQAILYIVDHRQAEHFGKLFAAARLWGYDDVELAHVSFGTILGEDGRPFKTRSGDTVGLEDLLDEAVRRAYQVVSESEATKGTGGEFSESQRQHVAEVVGIAALKYADLSQNRSSDYVFSYDKMLALNGNTATYLQYSYARVQGIFLRGNVDPNVLRHSDARIQLQLPDERALGLKLLGFGEAIDEVLVDYRPNALTSYLFDLTQTFFTFYENCPVLKAETAEVRDSRLLLCDLTARMIRQGLELLGIRVVDRM